MKVPVDIKIGFAKEKIIPSLGTELGGYAGYRPCTGVHDPLYCKAVVLEQDGVRYTLVALDLLCVDVALYQQIARAVEHLDIDQARLIVSAIHSHAAPLGVIPGEGPMAIINGSEIRNADFADYMMQVVAAVAEACRQAAANLESFVVRKASGEVPPVGSERHSGAAPKGKLHVLEFKTASEKRLIIYNFPCHPTVLSAANLEVSADFVAGIEAALDTDMAVFLNGAAGDISTRFTRQESSFRECARMGDIAASCIRKLLETAKFEQPTALSGIHKTIALKARQVLPEEKAIAQYAQLTARWQKAQEAGVDPVQVRILKSYAEGAGVNVEFSRTLQGIAEFNLPVTVFRFCGMPFVSIPGELFSTLLPEMPMWVIAYANGYYRYIADQAAYDANLYEAMAAIVARGEGEKLIKQILELIEQITI